ncbi:uncharacterized protein PRCAT00002856001 [Priceomyces carsonii]|uniref:uncharacterized protein n=1 Tax=Priceomyces carsonii TaxID=28549 RepID=UPI002EDB6893|nr:unnamed protein product [Priceomyces carsonii]
MNYDANTYELLDEDVAVSDGSRKELRSRRTGSFINQERIREVKRFNDFKTIDWLEDELCTHKKRVQRAQKQSDRAVSFKDKLLSTSLNWVILAIMGIIIGIIASILNIVTAWLASIRIGRCKNHFDLNKSFCCWGEGEECGRWMEWSNHIIINYSIYIIFCLAFSSAAAMLVIVYAPPAAGSGISEIKCIVSGFVTKGFLGWETLAIKTIGLPLAIGSGLSVGKEGPSVHYAVCVGNMVTKLVKRYRRSASKAREFLTATSAAGVAVAFGSPMGGVLFSIEEISSVFQLSTIWRSYFCSLVAVTTMAAINPFRTGQLVMFEVTYDTVWHYFEIPMYIILGIFGGLYGIIVSKLNIKVVSFRKRYLANFAIREVLFLSLLTSLISYFNEFLLLEMTESMQILFHECDKNFKHKICNPESNKINIFLSLIFATIARMAFTIITYGCKVPAGIFVPSMAAGATFGRALGLIMSSLHQRFEDSVIFLTCSNGNKCIIPGTYAFLGAAAALSGITQLTVTVVIIMFELTGAVRYIIPTMIVVAITKSINDKWGHGGIADQMISFNGLPVIDSKEDFSFDATVESAMTPVVVTFVCDESDLITVGKLKDILKRTPYRGYPIIQSPSQPRIVGYILRSEILEILQRNEEVDDNALCNFEKSTRNSSNKVDFSSIINRSPLTIHINTSLEYVFNIFAQVGPRYILVEKEGLLVGNITRKDILRYGHTLHSLNNPHTSTTLDIFEEKVWNLMQTMGMTFKKGLGKLIHNDENRYLRI